MPAANEQREIRPRDVSSTAGELCDVDIARPEIVHIRQRRGLNVLKISGRDGEQRDGDERDAAQPCAGGGRGLHVNRGGRTLYGFVRKLQASAVDVSCGIPELLQLHSMNLAEELYTRHRVTQ